MTETPNQQNLVGGVAAVRRRLKSIPLVLLLTVLATPLYPVVLVGTVVADLFRRDRFVLTRMWTVGLVFLWVETAAIVASGAHWVWYRGDRSKLREAMWGLQEWWGRTLFSAIRRLLDLGLEVDGSESLPGGPILLFMRHASIIDNLLPLNLVSRPFGYRLRYILKKELLAYPALDIGGNRLPNYFVDRTGDTASELRSIRALAAGLGESDGVIIWPEGTRFTERKQELVLKRLERTKSELLERARSLKATLPPRLGGPLALIDAARGTDVIFGAHSGLEGFATVGQLLSGSVVGRTIRVEFWRIDAADIPQARDQLVDWLFEQWSRVDDFVVAHAGA